MKTFEEFIDESASKDLMSIYIGAVEYARRVYGISQKVALKSARQKKGQFGSITLSTKSQSSYVVKVDMTGGMRYVIHNILHEMTHVKQMAHGDLKLDDEMIVWKGKVLMSITEYARVRDYTAYAKIPFEAEAILAAKNSGVDKCIVSNEIQSLRTNSKIVDYYLS